MAKSELDDVFLNSIFKFDEKNPTHPNLVHIDYFHNEKYPRYIEIWILCLNIYFHNDTIRWKIGEWTFGVNSLYTRV